MSTLLSTAYLGNIQYYTKLISGEAEIDLWKITANRATATDAMCLPPMESVR